MRAGVLGCMGLLAMVVALPARSQCAPPKGAVYQPPTEMDNAKAQDPTPTYQGDLRSVTTAARPLFAAVQIASGPMDGVVASQFPAPGIRVIPGRQTLWLCMKAASQPWYAPLANGLISALTPKPDPGNKPVPNLQNDSRQDAINALNAVNMKAKFATPQGDDTWGVIQQSIPPQSSEPRGTDILVTMGPPVPSLRGHTASDGEQMLSSSGLSLGQTHGGTKGAGDQTILAQNPPAGTFVAPGATVDIWLPTAKVSTAPVAPTTTGNNTDSGSSLPPRAPDSASQAGSTGTVPSRAEIPPKVYVNVPDVLDMSEPEAQEAIHARGLTESVAEQDGTGVVILQHPDPEDQVEVGSIVYVKHKPELPAVLAWLLWTAGIGVSALGVARAYRTFRGRRLLADTELKPVVDPGVPGVKAQARVKLELRGRPGDGAVTLRRSAAVEKMERGWKR